MSGLKARLDRLTAERARIAARDELGAVLWLPDNGRGFSAATLYDIDRRKAALDAGQDEQSALEAARLSPDELR